MRLMQFGAEFVWLCGDDCEAHRPANHFLGGVGRQQRFGLPDRCPLELSTPVSGRTSVLAQARESE